MYGRGVDPLLGPTGVNRATEAFGAPLERDMAQSVGEDTYRYWETMRRRRVAEVVLALKRSSGRYLVHTKEFYPPGIFRLPTGGVKPGEDLVTAVRRETLEETNLRVSIDRFLGILDYRFVWQGKSLPFTSYVFALSERADGPETGDSSQPLNVSLLAQRKERISGFREVILADLVILSRELEALPADWADWGRFRAPAHRFVAEVLGAGDTLDASPR